MDVGTVFKTHEEFLTSLAKFELLTHTAFVLKTSEKAETSNKRRKIKVPLSFPFARQHYTCSHFGSVRERKRKLEETPKSISKSIKVGCKAEFSITYDDRKGGLVVTKSVLEHNHHSDANTYSREYKVKRLNSDQRKELQDVVNVKPNNEKLLHFIKSKYGKSLSLADVRSLKYQLKRSGTQQSTANDLLDVLADVEECGPFELTLSENKEDVLIDMIAFSTRDMINLYNAFPEVIYMDGTYRVNQSGYPLYQLMVEDSAGRGRPVFYAFVRLETSDLLTHMLSVFKSFVGGDISKTAVFMTDKCLKERHAIFTIFPEVKSLLCHFHVHKAFKEKISTLALSKEQKQTLKTLTHQLVTIECEVKFVNVLQKISAEFPIFFSYLEKHWLTPDIVNHWPTCKRLGIPSLGSDTNNICESENKRLKKLLCSSTSLPMAVIELVNHSRVQHGEVLQEQFNASVTKTMLHSANSLLVPFYESFVKHAAIKMVANHEKLSSVSVSEVDGVFVCSDGSSSYKLTSEEGNWTCHCPFHRQTTLPCVHLVSLVANDLLDAGHIIPKNNRYLRSKMVPSTVSPLTQSSLPVCKRVVCSPSSRHHKTEAALARLSVYLKSCGTQEFEDRIAFINDGLALWTSGKGAKAVEVVDYVTDVDSDQAAVVNVVEGADDAGVVNLVDGTRVVSVIEGVDGAVVSFDGVVGVDGAGVVSVVDGVDGAGVVSVVDGVDGAGVVSVVDGVDGAGVVSVVDGVGSVVDGVGSVVDGVDGAGVVSVVDGVDGAGVVSVVDGVDGAGVGSVVDGVDGAGVGSVVEDPDTDSGEHACAVGVSGNVKTMDSVGIQNGAANSITYTRSRGAEERLTLETVKQMSLTLPQAKVRGRPRQFKTKSYKSRRLLTGQINMDVCHMCLQEEVPKDRCVDGKFMDWTGCTKCVRWFHNACICFSDKESFVCFQCLYSSKV
ncbi:hypothetical protein EGW08_023520 [Elysia chlorotica]|uniref:SWIM-type domain-containing protein n=1 Tax=Elysia chlorotica TaxID=188477 RepID=A0A3S1GYI8_ELYCH|nr:hypothetical protein EGW08_023520 [Elysia chlorotica]